MPSPDTLLIHPTNIPFNKYYQHTLSLSTTFNQPHPLNKYFFEIITTNLHPIKTLSTFPPTQPHPINHTLSINTINLCPTQSLNRWWVVGVDTTTTTPWIKTLSLVFIRSWRTWSWSMGSVVMGWCRVLLRDGQQRSWLRVVVTSGLRRLICPGDWPTLSHHKVILTLATDWLVQVTDLPCFTIM